MKKILFLIVIVLFSCKKEGKKQTAEQYIKDHQSQKIEVEYVTIMTDPENKEKIDDTAAREARHAENNVAWIKSLREELERIKAELAAMKDA